MLPSELLAKPEAWTQGTAAMDAQGFGVHPNHESAVCWCLTGACRKVAETGDEVRDMVYMLHAKLPDDVWGDVFAYSAVQQWNDMPERTHDEVLALLKSCNL